MLHNACPQCQKLLFKGTTCGYVSYVHERLTGKTATRQQACYRACCLVAFKDKKSLNMLLYTVPETTLCGRLRTRCFSYLESDTFCPAILFKFSCLQRVKQWGRTIWGREGRTLKAVRPLLSLKRVYYLTKESKTRS
jgi:hypothetical protein